MSCLPTTHNAQIHKYQYKHRIQTENTDDGGQIDWVGLPSCLAWRPPATLSVPTPTHALPYQFLHSPTHALPFQFLHLPMHFLSIVHAYIMSLQFNCKRSHIGLEPNLGPEPHFTINFCQRYCSYFPTPYILPNAPM